MNANETEPHVLRWPEHRVEMAFRLIPAGAFRMGSRGYYAYEEPVHRVRIMEPFWMAETPVTQAQFTLWTRAEGIEHENHFKDRPDHPAENMDWRQAVSYCDWITRTKEAEFPPGFHLACLPTEAEWEYACRRKPETKDDHKASLEVAEESKYAETNYYTGDGEAALAEAGWFYQGLESTSTHPVRKKTRNGFKLYDMHGNVWEWCYDAWDAAAYRRRVDGDPDPGLEVRNQDWLAGLESLLKSDRARVLRGGSWNYSARYCRSAYRNRFGPGDRFRCIGFRVCLVRGPAGQPDSRAEPASGDGGRGTRPESDGAGGATGRAPEVTQAGFPRAAGRKKTKKPKNP